MSGIQFQSADDSINRTPCVFEKAVLSGCITCELASSRTQGERQSMLCDSRVARNNCATLFELLRERSTFPLRLPKADEPIVHATIMKLQCGGLAALQKSLGNVSSDVHRAIIDAQARWGSLLDLPWHAIVEGVTAWQGRRRRATPKKP